MLQPHLGTQSQWGQSWEELGEGVPSLSGFARLCSLALAAGARTDIPFSLEAKALLFAARNRGLLEVKGSHRSFDAPARMLALHVETTPQHTLVFRNRERPEYTIRMLAGFRELCAAGLVMHHIHGEFSLTREGFDVGRTVDEDDVRSLLKEATELGDLE